MILEVSDYIKNIVDGLGHFIKDSFSEVFNSVWSI